MKRQPTILEPWLGVEPWRYADEATDEASRIAARAASHARWSRRRSWLRLRAALFGRGRRKGKDRAAGTHSPGKGRWQELTRL